MTETEKIIRQIEKCAPLKEAELISLEAWRFLKSEERQWMLTGQRYYQNEGDICLRRRLVIGENGLPQEDPTLINCRIAHGFVRKLVDQKCQYLFGRPFTIRAENAEFAAEIGKIFDR